MFKKFLTSTLLILVAVGGFFMHSELTIDSNNNLHLHQVLVHAAGVVADNNNLFAADANKYIAGQEAAAAEQSKATKEMLDKLVAAINIILNILTIIVTPAIMLATWLMSPDWTAGDIFGLRPVLHELWITVSNITYFIYAILLIFIALATIFNSEHYGYKAMLPKLALGIIMVPLTWWAVQFTVSLASYVTASAISIPAETIEKYTDKNTGSWWTTASIPKEISYQNDKFSDSSTCSATIKCLSPETIVKNAGGMFSPLLIYSFAVFKIQDIKNIQTTTDVVTTIFSLIHQGIIGILMFIIYGLLVLALIFMLMMRTLKLWFYAIFSPLFTIKYVLGDKAFGDADKDGSMNITEFIGLAFVPAVVCIALSFGLVIISAMMSPLGNANNPDNNCNGTKCTIVIMGIPSNTIVSDVVPDPADASKKVSQTIVTIGGVSYTWQGSVSGSTPALGGLKSALGATGNLFGTIIIDIIALVFIWIAFMAGKGVSKAASAAIAPFESMGQQIGKLGMNLPKYMPIPGTGGLSMKSMEKVPGMVEQGISTRADKQFKEDSKLGNILTTWSGAANAGDVAKAKEAVNNYKGQDSVKYLHQALQAMHGEGKGEKVYADHDFQKVLDKFAEKIKSGDIKKNDLDSTITNISIRDQILKKTESGTLSEDDRAVVAAWLAGNTDTSLTAIEAKRWLADKKKATSTDKASEGLTAAKLNDTNININLRGDTLFTINPTDISKLDLKTLDPEKKKYIEDNITEDDMRKILNSTMTKEQQDAFIKKASAGGVNFKPK